MDVADILGVNKSQSEDIFKSFEDSSGINSILSSSFNNSLKNKGNNQKNKIKPKGMSRELYSLMGVDGVIPSIQTNSSQTNNNNNNSNLTSISSNQSSGQSIGLNNLFKDKRSHGRHGKWVWSSFKNSARRYFF